MTCAPDITERELRQAFRLSGLWRDGWTFAKAIHTGAVYIGLCATVTALRGKACPEQRRMEQQQHGKPAPLQRAIF